jgi:hypothetical protein
LKKPPNNKIKYIGWKVMTTIYNSKEEALSRGIFYAGRTDLKVGELKKIDGKVYQFGVEIDSELYELENVNGLKVTLGLQFVGKDKFCLWLIAPEGIAVRT